MVKIFAHRGFSREYPENTIIAFEKAIEIGVDGIEIDVQMTKDGKLVIIHDETIDRTSEGSGYVYDYTYEELLEYDFSSKFKEKVKKQRIPLLSEFLELIKKAGIIANIEIKNSIVNYKGIEKKIYDLVEKYNLKEQVIISSFNHQSILKMKTIDNNIKCGFLVDSIMINPEDYINTYQIECYHPSAYLITKEMVEQLHNKNIEVNVWLSKYKIDYKKLISTGVDIIISDDPDIIKNIIKNNS